MGQCEHVTLAGQELHQSIVVKRHQTVKKVTEAMEALSYNTAIAALMELLNVMRETNCSERHIVKDMVVMLAPFAPHFAEECWERLGAHDHGVRRVVADLGRGAHRRGLDGNPGAGQRQDPRQGAGAARGGGGGHRRRGDAEEDAVRRFTEGKELKKQIYVPGRLLNLVVG